ncbi:MAG: EthD family reductase [Anaerolineales bacterium]|nr:EthD family reductase [Anaerolineales bacterium]
MYKLTLLFHDHPSVPDLVARWQRDFVPLAEKLPGLRQISVSHVDGGPAGPVDIRLIHELIFVTRESLMAAMQSPAGVAAGQSLVKITKNAPGAVTMLFAEHQTDAPPAEAA